MSTQSFTCLLVDHQFAFCLSQCNFKFLFLIRYAGLCKKAHLAWQRVWLREEQCVLIGGKKETIKRSLWFLTLDIPLGVRWKMYPKRNPLRKA